MTTTLTRHTPVHAAPTRRRPIRWLVAAAVTALLATTSVVAVRWLTDDAHRDYLGADGWPAHGQAAYSIGSSGEVLADDRQRAAPIASLAKVMTAYLVLRAHPLPSGTQGPSITVTAADVADTARRQGRDESVVRVRAGERLTERQALLAVLLPSANNVAAMITRLVDPSVPRFVARMNATARRLGMRDTTYTDPSGYDPRTVSTAADQLRLARTAGSNPTLAAMVATTRAQLPVQGTVDNTDTLLGHDGFVGMKTGSDDAAGGCFMFHARRAINGHRVDVWGAVLGQQGRHALTAGLYAARQFVEHVSAQV